MAVVGGGAAGIFAAIACAEKSRAASVIVVEKGPHFLSKVRISGGGRCNVTHACFDPRRLSEFYPRGAQALIGPFHVFQPRDVQVWFESRGAPLKIETDGRMFPVTNSSGTIVNCLLHEARRAGVRLISDLGVGAVERAPSGGFELSLTGGERLRCDHLMLATGGCRAPAAAKLALDLGHSLVQPVPSLFAFQLAEPWLVGLAGVSVQDAEVSVPGRKLRQRGALLITHSGISGPAVLRASAWGARELHDVGYQFTARVNWVTRATQEQLTCELRGLKARHSGRRVGNIPLPPLPTRLWEALIIQAGIAADTRWAGLSRVDLHRLLQQVTACDLQVTGKNLNKEEFVTCGGVPLREVNFKTMESRICPGLYFGGELLDIDGVTGGFNFQSAWTTGWIAGRAMAGQSA